MFTRRFDDPAASLDFTFEGQPLKGRQGDSVAAALLGAGVRVFRQTPVKGSDRGPFCLMGTCFDCLVEIDGEPNRQACMVPLRNNMAVRLQRRGARIAP